MKSTCLYVVGLGKCRVRNANIFSNPSKLSFICKIKAVFGIEF